MVTKMKLCKKSILVSLALIASTITSPSFAGGNSGKQILEKVRVNVPGVVTVWGQTGDWANPDACSSSKYIVLLPEINSVINDSYSEMYALLIAGYLQGKTISSQLNGCFSISGTTYPIIRDVTSF